MAVLVIHEHMNYHGMFNSELAQGFSSQELEDESKEDPDHPFSASDRGRGERGRGEDPGGQVALPFGPGLERGWIPIVRHRYTHTADSVEREGVESAGSSGGPCMTGANESGRLEKVRTADAVPQRPLWLRVEVIGGGRERAGAQEGTRIGTGQLRVNHL